MYTVEDEWTGGLHSVPFPPTPTKNFPLFPPRSWRPQSKIRFTLQLHSSSVWHVLFLPVGIITKKDNRPCSSRQVGMNIWRVLVAEIFLSSEHHHKWVRDEVCYRDVPSADVREVGEGIVTFLSQVWPSNFAIFPLFYKTCENND